MYSSEKLSRPCYFSGHLETKKSSSYHALCLGLRSGTISLTATTYRERTLCKWPFCFSVKYCFKTFYRTRPLLKFLNPPRPLFGQKWEIFFSFLFPVTDHPAWSCMIVTKSSLKWHKMSSFNSANPASFFPLTTTFRTRPLFRAPWG